MKASHHLYIDNHWTPALPEGDTGSQLVLCFGNNRLLFEQGQAEAIRHAFPNAEFTGCTTAGEISGRSVHDYSITATAIEFEKTDLQVITEPMHRGIDSFELAKRLAAKLMEKPDLKHVFIITEGLLIKGDALSQGFSESLPEGVSVTGGMAGQGTSFEDTRVWYQDSGAIHQIVAIGLYGKHLEVGYGSIGGWDSFGPKRKVTRSDDNILFELDGQSALDMYKKYLGEKADELPSSGLQFPLMLCDLDDDNGPVRAVQGIDEEEQSMEFAGSLPEGKYVRLMRANFDRLIDGAYQSAINAKLDGDEELAILVSCVGRRVVLQQRIDEEVENAVEALGEDCVVTGFYSYGELCPLKNTNTCSLHNETMTISTFKEV